MPLAPPPPEPAPAQEDFMAPPPFEPAPAQEDFMARARLNLLQLKRTLWPRPRLNLLQLKRSLWPPAPGSQRQRVLPAVQLFSESVGTALLFQGGVSLLVQRKAVLTVNAWFDTMNSRTPFNAVPHRCGLGKHEDMQLQALDEMQNLVEHDLL